MDKDRIEGSAGQAKGKIKEVAGKVTGDAKLESEGQADQVKGKVQTSGSLLPLKPNARDIRGKCKRGRRCMYEWTSCRKR